MISEATFNKALMAIDKSRRQLRIAHSYFQELNLEKEARELTEVFESLTEFTAKIEALERKMLFGENPSN